MATDLLHPSIEWNCLAAPDGALVGQFCGKPNLQTHLVQMSQWCEQFAVQPRHFVLQRTDAEGEMVYFQLVANCHTETGDPVEIWQTFICRLEVDLVLAVDHYIGLSQSVVIGDQRTHRQGTGNVTTTVRGATQ